MTGRNLTIPGTPNRPSPGTKRPVRDNIGRLLIAIFLIKPLVDLFPAAAIWVGPLRVAPTTVFGFAAFFLLAPFLMGRGRLVPPYGRIFEAFLVINGISILLGIITGRGPSLVGILNGAFRILDSYAVYAVAFLAAMRYRYNDVTPFVTAIVVGSAIVVPLNIAAVTFGWTGFGQSPEMTGSVRERGLYYDAGVLAYVAFFSLVFTVFRFHLARRNRVFWLVVTVIIVFADLYFIAASKSRAVIILLGVSGLLYMALYQKAWGKIAAPVVAGGLLLLGTVFFSATYQEALSRFETDVAALEDESESRLGVSASGRVSLGKFEGLGSNRGAVWAAALTEILRRESMELLVGNFSTAVGGHSDYIDVLARNGAVGLILYLTLFVGLTLKTFREVRAAPRSQERAIHFLAFTLLLCYLLYALPFRPLLYTTSAWYMWTMVAMSMAAATNRLPAPRAEKADPSRSWSGPASTNASAVSSDERP